MSDQTKSSSWITFIDDDATMMLRINSFPVSDADLAHLSQRVDGYQNRSTNFKLLEELVSNYIASVKSIVLASTLLHAPWSTPFLQAIGDIQKSTNIEKLTLLNDDLEHAREEKISAIQKILANSNVPISNVEFSRCVFDRKAMGLLATALYQTPNHLVRLCLFSCQIDTEILMTLVQIAFQERTALKRLELQENELLASSLVTLTRLLQSQEELEHLDLSRNQGILDDTEPWLIQQFLEALRAHKVLRELLLTDIQLSNCAVHLLLVSLQGKPSLTVLNIAENPIQDGPWINLFAKNRSFHELFLPDDMPISMRRMINGIGRNTSLVKLDCHRTRWTFRDMVCRRNKILALSVGKDLPLALWPRLMVSLFGRGDAMNLEVIQTFVQDSHATWIPTPYNDADKLQEK